MTKRDTDQTAFRIGPLAVIVIGMVALGPLLKGFWEFCMFIAWHFSVQLDSLLFYGTLILVAAYLGVVITGVVLLRHKQR